MNQKKNGLRLINLGNDPKKLWEAVQIRPVVILVMGNQSQSPMLPSQSTAYGRLSKTT